MPFAPSVELPNGESCIPQHYLEFHQSLASLQALVADVTFSDTMVLFADQDAQGLYLQVGVIGHENYARPGQPRQPKLVYGRKWRIETYTPSSEIIQTALLALKKAREHEVRELFKLRAPHSGKASTPFSCHQDLPLMARQRRLFAPLAREAALDREAILACLAHLRFDARPLRLDDLSVRAHGALLLELSLGPRDGADGSSAVLPEFEQARLSLLLDTPSRVALPHDIMDGLIRHSDRFVDAQMRYQGFARFSRQLDPAVLASLSVATRPYARDQANQVFLPVFERINQRVDAQRVPALGDGRLAHINRAKLGAWQGLLGHLPHP